MKNLSEQIFSLPHRRGLPPRTTVSNPHQQLDQNAPPELQEALFKRVQGLDGVNIEPSRISVPGARAFILDEELALGPSEAFMIGREFAHLHPSHDGSLHLMLPEALVESVIEKGWGELHPVARRGWLPPTALMVYGPRDPEELETVWVILQASHVFACGRLTTEQ